jgi:Prenyltransferase and squalene oxidase repeat
MTSTESTRDSLKSPAGASFVADVCLPFLKSARNQDGGWGFRAGAESRVEPTSWALLALRGMEGPVEPMAAAVRFLRSTQLADGSWPASPGQTTGCWATSLACWALARDEESLPALRSGLQWICADWPKDLNFVRRLVRKARSLARKEEISRQDDSLRGWGWTPHTASWVEPTAFALLALEQAPKELLPPSASERQRLGRLMLYNRMCPGGGWNCGNPMVYGVAGDPSIPQTAWALLALRNEPRGEAQASSLQWLEKGLKGAIGIGSLALTKICLETYGRELGNAESRFHELHGKNGLPNNVPGVAWSCLALEGRRANWLSGETD